MLFDTADLKKEYELKLRTLDILESLELGDGVVVTYLKYVSYGRIGEDKEFCGEGFVLEPRENELTLGPSPDYKYTYERPKTFWQRFLNPPPHDERQHICLDKIVNVIKIKE